MSATPAPVKELNPAEARWVEDHIGLLAQQGVDLDDPGDLARVYDEACERWWLAADPDRDDPNPMITLVGLGLGEHLCRAVGMHWATGTDDPGELCLATRDSELTLYPVESVAQRWHAREQGWVAPYLSWAKDRVRGTTSHDIP